MEVVPTLLGMAGIDPSSVTVRYDWRGIEERIGVSLPGDYKALASVRRMLRVGSITLRPPRQEGGFPGIIEATEEDAEIMHDLYDVEFGRTVVPAKKGGGALVGHEDAFGFHPQRPGLLAWGSDHIGGSYYWYTGGAPDRWTVVAYARDGWWDKHDMSMSEYLLGIATDSVHCDVPPQRFRGQEMFGEG